jgi:hypothetical protein
MTIHGFLIKESNEKGPYLERCKKDHLGQLDLDKSI